MVKIVMEKAEDFIGWRSEDGKLEVTGVEGKDKWGVALFKVTCTECSKDKELFPEGYFVSRKLDLIQGHMPCGCSNSPRWKDWQYLIKARRAGENKGFIVHGFAEEFKGVNTKLNLECLKDGYKWTAIISSVTRGQGCPKCYGKIKLTEQEALQNCIDICKEMDYEPIGLVDGYKGAMSTRFEYICKIHGKQNVIYNNFINKGRRCGGCGVDSVKNQQKTPEDIALQKCIDICKEMDYKPVGFVDEYTNAHETRFEYICKIHGKQNVSYNSFVRIGSRCRGCAKDKQKEIGNGNGYYQERKDEQDFLYILDFNNQFIKVGRSFNLKQRISSLKHYSKIKNIKKLRIFSGTHEQIYNLEQEIHDELRERNFQYYQDWSTECFDKDCLFILNNILDSCELQEI